MYLSRIKLNTARHETMTALVNPQRFHGAIESMYDENENARPRNLWRIDTLNGEMYLLVLTHELPRLTNAAQQFGYKNELIETKVYDPLLERITTGSRWQFRLTANPTKSVSQEKDEQKNKPRGKVTALISAKQQEEWLAERAEEYGFKLNRDEFRVTYSHRYSFKKNGKNQVTLLCVSFEGILTVTDAARFKQTMTEGIGRAKAYGNGLLTVVSPQNVSHG